VVVVVGVAVDVGDVILPPVCFFFFFLGLVVDEVPPGVVVLAAPVGSVVVVPLEVPLDCALTNGARVATGIPTAKPILRETSRVLANLLILTPHVRECCVVVIILAMAVKFNIFFGNFFC
jgi:hypothetical protein